MRFTNKISFYLQANDHKLLGWLIDATVTWQHDRGDLKNMIKLKFQLKTNLSKLNHSINENENVALEIAIMIVL